MMFSSSQSKGPAIGAAVFLAAAGTAAAMMMSHSEKQRRRKLKKSAKRVIHLLEDSVGGAMDSLSDGWMH